MTISANFSNVRPSLLLDFANEQALDPRITFTRSTTGAYYNGYSSAVAEQNLFTYSQQFTNAVWSPSSVTTVDNSVVAPDGTTTAALVTCSAGTATKYLRQLVTLSANGALSFYAKAGTGSYIQIIDTSNGARFCNFDLSLGVLGTAGGQATGTITSVGSGWYRCSVVFSAFNGSATAYGIYFVDSASATYATTATTTGTFNLWGAQLEQRSTVTAYTATTTTAITNYIPVLQTGAINQARFDHDPVLGTSLGLLIEQQSTNLLLQSQFASGWTIGGGTPTLSLNTDIAPDGTLTASKLIGSSSSGNQSIYQAVTTTAVANTQSVYAKAGEQPYLAISFGAGASTDGAYFNLSTGALGTLKSGTTATITSVGNGWYRCTATRTLSAGTNYAQFEVHSADNQGAWTGNGYSGIYIFGASLEALPFPTSYIPTVASQVTRSADSAIMTGTNFSSWYNQAEGTIYGEGTSISTTISTLANTGVDGVLSQNSISIGHTGTGTNSNFYNSGVLQANFAGTGSWSLTATNKMSIAVKNNDSCSAVNGTIGTTDTVCVVPFGINAIYIGGVVSQPFNGAIKKIAYYPIRVSNAQLQALTG